MMVSKNGLGPGPILVLDRVAKTYAGGVALAPLSMTVEAGERVAILGASGSGKTTLLSLIGGVTRPDQGNVRLDGRDLANIASGRELASLVGVMHQQLDLVPHLSVIHNVLAGRLGYWSLWRSLASLVSPQEAHLAGEALARVGIPEKLYERTSRLSGGEQQRVALARLLVQQSSVVLADEPVASLDPARAEDLMRLLAKIVAESNKTLIASLHSVGLTRRYFSRAIGLRDGVVQFDLPVGKLTDEILSRLYDLKEVQPQGQG